MKYALYKINYGQLTWHRQCHNDANKTVTINNGQSLLLKAKEGNVFSRVCMSVQDLVLYNAPPLL